MFVNVMLGKVRKIVNKLINLKEPFYYDTEKNKMYLYKFKEPSDSIERSYYQYKCQMRLYGRCICLMLNIVSILPLMYFLIKLKYIDDSPKTKPDYAVFCSNGLNNNIIPDCLLHKFNCVKNVNDFNIRMIDKEGKDIIRKAAKRYYMSPYFLIKNLVKVSTYCEIARKESCGTIICSCEYSFTSSILTYYCNCKNIKHINVMHGEKLFFIRDSFFQFNECYVWDLYYKELFIQLRAKCDDYFISIPQIFRSGIIYKDNSPTSDYKYYLQNEKKMELEKIYNMLVKLRDRGYVVAVRPHPLYSDKSLIKKIFEDISIENEDVDIYKSISSTKCVVAKYSTVIFQAYCNDINFAIDDLTNRKLYLQLKSLKYMMINKSNILLSDILGEYEM